MRNKLESTIFRLFAPIFFAVFLWFLAIPELLAQSANPYALLRKPAVSKTQIAFSYGGDLWVVDRGGGEAKRLTSDVGIEIDPVFSPDGTMIAFTGEYDGNEDVYVVPVAGGIPKRLTSHPGADQVVGWTRDGKHIAFRSSRGSYSGFTQLYTVSVSGGLPELLPLPMAFEGSYSPDSSQLAYVPFTNFRESWQFQRGLKHYRGGTASPIWIAKLSDSSVEKVERKDSNDSSPMWVGDKVYFLSDRDGPVSLYVYDTSSKQVKKVLASNGVDIKSASAGPDAIVYEEFGSIHVFDPASGKESAVNIHVSGNFPAVRAHLVNAAEQIENADLSPTGARAVFEAHGEILTAPVEHGDIRNLTNTTGAAERYPAWSPDGKWIAYFSDESGEYALHLRGQNGLGEVRKIGLGNPPSFFYDPTWTPDSKKICYTDTRLNVWYVDLDKGTPVLIDTDTYDVPQRRLNPAWSPDSRWISYTKILPNHMRAVFVYSLETGKSTQITDGMSDAEFAVFDKNSKSLYFTASTNIGPTTGWLDMSSYDHTVTRNPYLIVLRKDQPSPLAPESDEEKVKGAEKKDDATAKDTEKKDEAKGAESKDNKEKEKEKEPEKVTIDFDNISQRILALPIPAKDYAAMQAGKSGELFLLESPPGPGEPGRPQFILHKFDLAKRKTDTFLSGIQNFQVSFNGEKVLYQQGENWGIV